VHSYVLSNGMGSSSTKPASMRHNGGLKTTIKISEGKSDMKITRVGIDTTKSVFDICGSDQIRQDFLARKVLRKLWIVAINKNVG